MTVRQDYVISLLMSPFLIRSAISQSSSYPVVLTRLGGPRSTFKIADLPGIEPATSCLIVRHDHPRFTVYINLVEDENFPAAFYSRILQRKVTCCKDFQDDMQNFQHFSYSVLIKMGSRGLSVSCAAYK